MSLIVDGVVYNIYNLIKLEYNIQINDGESNTPQNLAPGFETLNKRARTSPADPELETNKTLQI